MAVAPDQTSPSSSSHTSGTALSASIPRNAAAPAVGLALAALATLVWSGSFVTSRALHDSVPPVQQAFWRWLGGAGRGGVLRGTPGLAAT